MVALRSIAADDLPADEVLYRRDGVTVMPSWLEVDGRQSYAVRSIIRLTMIENAPPRAFAIVFCIVMLGLALISGMHVLRASIPPGIAWTALLASLGFVLYTAHVAFVQPTDYRMQVFFNDGSSTPLRRTDRESMQELHRALSRAMERQRGWK